MKQRDWIYAGFAACTFICVWTAMWAADVFLGLFGGGEGL